MVIGAVGDRPRQARLHLLQQVHLPPGPDAPQPQPPSIWLHRPCSPRPATYIAIQPSGFQSSAFTKIGRRRARRFEQRPKQAGGGDQRRPGLTACANGAGTAGWLQAAAHLVAYPRRRAVLDALCDALRASRWSRRCRRNVPGRMPRARSGARPRRQKQRPELGQGWGGACFGTRGSGVSMSARQTAALESCRRGGGGAAGLQRAGGDPRASNYRKTCQRPPPRSSPPPGQRSTRWARRQQVSAQAQRWAGGAAGRLERGVGPCFLR